MDNFFRDNQSINDLKQRWNTEYGLQLKKQFLLNQLPKNMIDIRGIDISNEKIYKRNLMHFDLSYSNFRNSVFELVKMRKAQITYSDFSCAKFKSVQFEGANLKFAILHDTIFNSCNFIRAKLQGASLVRTSFLNSDLTNTSFEPDDYNNPTKLNFVDFSFSKLWGTRFNNSVLISCQFRDSHLYSIQKSNWSVNKTISDGVFYGPEKSDDHYQPFDDDLTFEEYFKHVHSITKWYSIPKSIRTATMQYLLFFKEYMEHTQGLTISVENLIRGNKVGITFRSNNFEVLKNIETHLRKYIGFVSGKRNIDYEGLSGKDQLAYKALELEVYSLKNRIETQQILIKDYHDILSKVLPDRQPINISTTVKSISSLSSKSVLNMKNEMNNKLDAILDFIKEKDDHNNDDIKNLITLLKNSNSDNNLEEIRNLLGEIAKNKETAIPFFKRLLSIGANIFIGACGSGTWEVIKNTAGLLLP
jgi:uncharacterized protein YjbI with pentapeptide repeats